MSSPPDCMAIKAIRPINRTPKIAAAITMKVFLLVPAPPSEGASILTLGILTLDNPGGMGGKGLPNSIALNCLDLSAKY